MRQRTNTPGHATSLGPRERAGLPAADSGGACSKGFTLIEVMMVVVIIGVLATLALVGYQRHLRSGRLVAAQEFVSVALVQPILKQMRQANQAPPPFGPGEGEKNFAHLADAQIARRIVESSNFGVVNAVEHQLLARLSPARTAAVLGDAPAQDEVATPPQEQP